MERDLREMVGRFEADERFTLEHNLRKLLQENREITPLLLPRQYYTGLPPANVRLIPRQPPRNCFVTLVPKGIEAADVSRFSDKVCPYFAENRNLGRYLFFSATLRDDSIVPLKLGDTNLGADTFKITVKKGDKAVSWWLALQTPTSAGLKGRYEITAFRENSNTKERDKRVEGWAYTQKQADGSQIVQIISRIDFKEFTSEAEYQDTESKWPPDDWENIKFFFSRRDATEKSSDIKNIEFDSVGASNLSVMSLAEPIYSAHAKLEIHAAESNGDLQTVKISSPPSVSRDEFHLGPFAVIEGDLLFTTNELIRYKILPDTGLTFFVTHPGNVVEKGVWQTLIGLAVLIILGIVVVAYFYRHLLKPIFVLTRQSIQLSSFPDKGDTELPYSRRVDEIGTLARGFNGLLKETRQKAARELSERDARRREENQRELEQIKIREANVNVIGHEIRSPLQALISLHPIQSESRRYIDRILAALPHLQGTLGPENAFSNRSLTLEAVDIAIFAADVAANVKLELIDNVTYQGPEKGVYCEVDDGAIEDAVIHILTNAKRFRSPHSPIQIELLIDEIYAYLSITNIGPNIDDEIINRIFDFGFTTTANERDAGSGVGLFVAKNYITRMSGTIKAVNVEDGVCFVICLPLVKK